MKRNTWPALAREAANALSRNGEDDSARVLLLQDIGIIMTERNISEVPSSELVEILGKMDERPWPEWKNGKPLTQRQIARLLKPFEVKPKQIWTVGGNVRGYVLEDLKDALSRYVGGIDPLDR